MITALISSSTIFIILVSLYIFENKYGVRVFGNFRTKLDNVTDVAINKILNMVIKFFELIHKDVVLYLLHVATYIVLLLLRFAEAKLEKVIFFLKSFRRKGNSRISKRLKKITKTK